MKAPWDPLMVASQSWALMLWPMAFEGRPLCLSPVLGLVILRSVAFRKVLLDRKIGWQEWTAGARGSE